MAFHQTFSHASLVKSATCGNLLREHSLSCHLQWLKPLNTIIATEGGPVCNEGQADLESATQPLQPFNFSKSAR